MPLLTATAEQDRALRRWAMRLVGAHFVPWQPRAPRDDDPTPGQNIGAYWDGLIAPSGQYAAVGGLQRDRRVPADVLPDSWTQDQCLHYDAVQDVQDAISAGLNCFYVDMVDMNDLTSRNMRMVGHLADAAHEVAPGAFWIVLEPDMTGGGGVAMTQSTFVAAVAAHAGKPAIARTPDGRVIVAPFTPETKPYAFYAGCADALAGLDVDVAFWWVVQDFPGTVDAFSTAAATYGLGLWGEHSVDGAERDEIDSLAARPGRGFRWIAPVGPQDWRPAQRVYDEAVGTRFLARSFQTARLVGADAVQAVTWNDFAEGTHVCPSVRNGRGWLDLLRLQVEWWRTGRPPVVAEDFAALVHRPMHTASALVSGSPQTDRAALRGGSTATVNMVEAYTWLTAPGTVTVTVGGVAQTPYVAPAGEHVATFPITTATAGAPSLAITRGGVQVATLNSTTVIKATGQPPVEDLGYYATALPLVLVGDEPSDPDPEPSDGLVTAFVKEYV